jgi:hypothetical protein
MISIKKILKVNPEEIGKVKYLAGFFFVIGFYNTMNISISFSVFDIRFGAKYLPFMYLLFPFVNALFTIFFIKKLPKMNKRSLFRVFIFIVFLVHVLDFLILKEVFSFKLVYVFLIISSIAVVENLSFLSVIVVGEVVTIESIKRLLPLSTASLTIGSIAAAFVINNFSVYFKPEYIFLATTLAIPLTAYFADVLLKRFRVIQMEEENIKKGSFIETFKYMKENSFFFLLILLAVFIDITVNVNNNFYNIIASGFFNNEKNLVSFVGSTETYRYILSLAIDLFLFTIVIMKIGTPNTVKAVLLSAIAGIGLMALGERNVNMALISKIIFSVLVYQMSFSLVQILFQPANKRYKENVLIISDMFVKFIGCIVGGLVSLMYAYGYLNIYSASVVCAVATLMMLVLWYKKQSGFITATEKTLNFSDDIDLRKLFGSRGIANYIPILEEKLKHGNYSDMVFALDFTKRVDLKEKEEFMLLAYRRNNIEIKLKIIEDVFERNVSNYLLLNIIEYACPEVQSFIIKKMFQNYMNFNKEYAAELISSRKELFDKNNLDNVTSWMYEYLFEDNKDRYELILQHFSAVGKNDNSKVVIQIMSNFIGIEDSINQMYLLAFMFDLNGHKHIIKGIVELCSIYDNNGGIDMTFLSEVLSGYCNIEIMESVCKCYGSESVINLFKDNDLLIPEVYVLYAATKGPLEKIENYFTTCLNLKKKLISLIKEKSKIAKLEHPVKGLLMDEINFLIASVKTVIIDYLFRCHHIHIISNLEKHLLSDNKKDMVCEIIIDSLPSKVVNEILPIINEKTELDDEKSDYSVLIVGGMHQGLANLYMLLGGESMEEGFKKEIEKIALLKFIPLFNNLDIDELYELIRIAEFIEDDEAQTIITKGEPGDKFFVVLDGEVGVYYNETEDYSHRIGAGGIFGELAVISESRRTATIKTLVKTKLLMFNGSDFTSLLKKNGNLALTVIRVLSKRLKSVM